MLSEHEALKIKDSFLFKNIPQKVTDRLIKKSIRQTLSRGETLFVQGDAATRMFVVLAGWVKLTRITRSGDEVVVAVYTEGNSFGEAAAMMGGLYPVTVVAATDCQLLQVRASTISELINKEPDLAVAMLAATFGHLHELVREVESMKAHNGVQRLATFLVALAPVTNGSCTFSLPYDKLLLAGRLGMQPESLSRSFASLREFGVMVSRNSIAIAEMGNLTQFIDQDKQSAPRMVKH